MEVGPGEGRSWGEGEGEEGGLYELWLNRNIERMMR